MTCMITIALVNFINFIGDTKLSNILTHLFLEWSHVLHQVHLMTLETFPPLPAPLIIVPEQLLYD